MEYTLTLHGLQAKLCVFQVGFMKDGRITAADLQYYANAGNTVDESPLVKS